MQVRRRFGNAAVTNLLYRHEIVLGGAQTVTCPPPTDNRVDLEE